MGKIEKDVEFGLERFTNDRKVEIPLRDALYAYKVIGEFISFFHQPDHYGSLSDVQRFLATSTKVAFMCSGRSTTVGSVASGLKTYMRRSTTGCWTGIRLSMARPNSTR